jgi:hypothetical protein
MIMLANLNWAATYFEMVTTSVAQYDRSRLIILFGKADFSIGFVIRLSLTMSRLGTPLRCAAINGTGAVLLFTTTAS